MTNVERWQVNWVYAELRALRRRAGACDEGFGCYAALRVLDQLIAEVRAVLVMSQSESASGAGRIVAEDGASRNLGAVE